MKKYQLLVCLCLFFTTAMVSVGQAAVITVINNTELVNGDTSSPENLINNPGSDGISLPEAIYAANASPGPHTILFNPSLKESTIKITHEFALSRDQITVEGDINKDGKPDITIDGASYSSTCFRIQASDISISGLTIVNFTKNGIEFFAGSEEGNNKNIERVKLIGNNFTTGGDGIVMGISGHSCTIKNVYIISNNFINNGGSGIDISAGGGRGGSNNRIMNLTIKKNIIRKSGKHAICAMAAGEPEGINNEISGLEISENTIKGHTTTSVLISGGNFVKCKNNRVNELLIFNNTIEGAPGVDQVTIEIVGGAEKDANGNVVSNVAIVKNTIRYGGIQMGVGCFGGKNNIIKNILIGWNKILNSFVHGISMGGGSRQSNTINNTAKKITILNNLIVNSEAIGIQLLGGRYSGPDNLIDNVNILNNTIVKNGHGHPSWAYGIVLLSNNYSSGNLVQRVKIKNTILWGNNQNDQICGESPDSVECSILLDSRFTGKNGNFYASPQFISSSNLNYRLRQTSPAIDSGSSDVTGEGDIDLMGYPRTLDGNWDGDAVVDIGSYEFAEKKKPKVEYFKINEGASHTFDRMVSLDNKCNGVASECMAAEDKKFTRNVKSGDYFASLSYQLSSGYGKKKVYFKVKNESGWSKIKKSTIMFEEPEGGQPSILHFTINTGDDITIKRNVKLHYECSGDPSHYRASESLSDFYDKKWKPFTKTIKHKLSNGLGKKTIYFQVKNVIGESGVVCDQISAFYPWR